MVFAELIRLIQLVAFALVPVMSAAMTIILWSRPHHDALFGHMDPTLCHLSEHNLWHLPTRDSGN